MTRLALSILISAGLASACRPAPSSPPPVDPAPVEDAAPSPTPERAHATAGPAVECGPPIDHLDAIVKPGGLVLFGELHGTEQLPAFVGDVACAAAANGLTVRVGLEIPRGQSEALATYLGSEGTPTDREALVDAEHWLRPDQDGRSSEAMLALIDRIRLLRTVGLDVDLFAFDVDPTGPTPWNVRDRAMAERILARATAEPDALVLTLSGNLHNRTEPGLPWDAEAIPMGVHLQQVRPDLVSLDARYSGGSAWICAPACGATEVGGAKEGSERGIELWPEPNDFGHHGSFGVGSIDASPPAVPPTTTGS